MVIVSRKSIIKSMSVASLSFSLSLVACFSNQGAVIDKADIGVRRNISENDRNSLSPELQDFLNQYSDKIHIHRQQFPNDLPNNTEYVSSDCRENDQSVISGEDDTIELNIYVGESLDSNPSIDIISCGLRRFQNKIQSTTTVNSLINQIAKTSPDRGRQIRAFYNDNQENIQVSLQEFDITEDSELSVFVNHLDLDIDIAEEGDRYVVNIDSGVEENVQAHLLAHALSIIEIETNEGNRGIVDQKVDLDFSTVQQLYYGNNNGALISQLNLNSGENRDETQVIAAFYFYSRFHSYSTNQALKQAGLELDQDLSNESISDEIIVDLETRKNLTTETSYFEELVVGKGFAVFLDVLLNIEPLPVNPIDLESLNNKTF